MTTRVTVWPDHQIAPSLLKDLAHGFPTSLLIYHPLFGWWQHYEDEHRLWDAQRLYNAVRAYYVAGEQADWRWWNSPRSPRLVDDRLPEPGSWLLLYLGQRDLFRSGGARRFFAEFEQAERDRKERRLAAQHALNLDISKDARRHIADVIRGDGLAGQRRYVHTVPMDLRGNPDGQDGTTD